MTLPAFYENRSLDDPTGATANDILKAMAAHVIGRARQLERSCDLYLSDPKAAKLGAHGLPITKKTIRGDWNAVNALNFSFSRLCGVAWGASNGMVGRHERVMDAVTDAKKAMWRVEAH